MNMLYRFWKISFNDKIFLIRTYFLVWIIRLMLWVFKIQTILKFSEKISSTNDKVISIDKIVWAVNSTSIYVPKASCLTRSIVAKTILERYNYKSEIKIGVAKDDEGHLNAHAWVEVANKTVIGGSGIEYTPILADLNKCSIKLD